MVVAAKRVQRSTSRINKIECDANSHDRLDLEIKKADLIMMAAR